ncbi:MAG: type II toxin-antitoxin system HicB family antitoxin [Chloroflexi bacterium]|nr:type II toxin-antitoxin system HicB family antitoxin [Chloroflexota bacterium]
MLRLLTWNEYVRLVLSYAVFSHNEDGSWTVEIPVLPGCVTWGETRAEAAVMAEDAVQGWLMTTCFGSRWSRHSSWHPGGDHQGSGPDGGGVVGVVGN